MATGLELAGLALGMFPVIIQCLQWYLKFFEETQTWWRYAKKVKSLLRDIEMERMKFENNCEELLFEVVDPAQLDALLADPNGPHWQQTHLQSALKSSLGKAVGLYLETVTELKNVLNVLQSRLQKAMPSEGIESDVRKTDRLRLLRLSLMDASNATLLNKLNKHNNELGSLLGHRKRMTAVKLKRASAYTRTLSALRERAQRVFELVKDDNAKRCRCIGYHQIGLQLEIRCDMDALVAENSPPDEQAILRTLFATSTGSSTASPSWYWRQIIFKPRDLELPDSSAQPLIATGENSSRIFTASRARSSRDRPLVVEPRLRQKMQKYIKKVTFSKQDTDDSIALSMTAVVQAVNRVDAETECVYSMQEFEGLCQIARATDEDLIKVVEDNTKTRHEVHVKWQESNSKPLSFKPLFDTISSTVDRKATFRLAIVLTASVLQLHNTPWLSDTWSSRDVVLAETAGDSIGEASSRLYVHRMLNQHEDGQWDENDGQVDRAAASINRVTHFSGPVIRNRNLFSLGITLMEIWFRKPIEQLRTRDDTKQLTFHEDAVRMATATRLINDVYGQAGDWYGDAVRRCLHCDFNQRHTELSHGAMKEAVFTGVMMPLVKSLEAFCGGNLAEMNSPSSAV